MYIDSLKNKHWKI